MVVCVEGGPNDIIRVSMSWDYDLNIFKPRIHIDDACWVFGIGANVTSIA